MLPAQDGVEIARRQVPLHGVRQRQVGNVALDRVDRRLRRVRRPPAIRRLVLERRERGAFEV